MDGKKRERKGREREIGRRENGRGNIFVVIL